MNDMFLTDDVAGVDMIVENDEMSGMEGQLYDSEFTSMPEDSGFKMSNNLILGIVISVCAVIGIVLGIIFGRRAARK